jgi:hypothetical protein
MTAGMRTRRWPARTGALPAAGTVAVVEAWADVEDLLR